LVILFWLLTVTFSIGAEPLVTVCVSRLLQTSYPKLNPQAGAQAQRLPGIPRRLQRLTLALPPFTHRRMGPPAYLARCGWWATA